MTENNNYNVGDDFNLELEFASLGFDFKSMLNSIRYINEWSFLLTIQGFFGYTGTNPDWYFFLFTVVQLEKQHHSIYSIQATLLTSVPNLKRTRIIRTKEYWSDNDSLPTKQAIVNEFGKMRDSPWIYANSLSKFFNPAYTSYEELN
jgi:hypothetical protein